MSAEVAVSDDTSTEAVPPEAVSLAVPEFEDAPVDAVLEPVGTVFVLHYMSAENLNATEITVAFCNHKRPLIKPCFGFSCSCRRKSVSLKGLLLF